MLVELKLMLLCQLLLGNNMDKFILILPIIMIVESIGASIIFLLAKMYGSSIYWLSAAILNISVVFLIKKFG